ncbi:Alpha/beta hydrolase fold-3 [Penicillium griseofulvum]|uniref:Alpha/beta hydrolase fold-3 n=1 Tax=Penicillium patulum TaxID=5078 RepID=A0A135LUT5_PENPA|nr:Alpha/beta hydrolase fold-3 [Penicillium griseofulvum]KXG52738.1 Alpha/beta hydrolase fold-3 [Penicillium griseofulvum]
MADFTEYGTPSAEWVALEPTLPELPKNLSVEQLKALVNKGREVSAAEDMIGLSAAVQLQDHTITARDGTPLEARTYRPAGIPISERLPVYVHLHGGGFLFGTLSSEDATCSRIVTSRVQKGTPVVVFNINYRHTPEYPYPTAWNDVEDAFVWLHENIADIGGISEQVVVGGISAGAWLTASLALAQLRGEDKRLAACPKIAGQVLMIPCVVQWDHYAPRLEMLKSPDLSSYVQCADAPVLPVTRMKLFTELLGLVDTKDAAGDRRMSPGNATAEEVKDLPPTTFGIAGNDPLRDEGLFYAQHLAANGIPTNVHVFPGVPHGFRRYKTLPDSKRWDEVMSDGIAWALTNPSPGPFEIKSK